MAADCAMSAKSAGAVGIRGALHNHEKKESCLDVSWCCMVQPGALCAERSSCEGSGLSRAQAGVPTTFQVIACDRFGNRQTAGGDDIRVQVSTAASDKQALVRGSVADNGRGLYEVRFHLLLSYILRDVFLGPPLRHGCQMC